MVLHMRRAGQLGGKRTAPCRRQRAKLGGVDAFKAVLAARGRGFGSEERLRRRLDASVGKLHAVKRGAVRKVADLDRKVISVVQRLQRGEHPALLVRLGQAVGDGDREKTERTDGQNEKDQIFKL